MDFYLFCSDFKLIPDLEDAGFEGVLFVYNALGDDKFTHIAKSVSGATKIKHMVAIRPYVISPQYLSMIHKSLNKINPFILQVNLISGHIKDEEKDYGGIIGPVNHFSTSEEKSNYLIEYIESLENLKSNIPDYYVSVSNEFTFKTAKKYNSKMIIGYSHYQENMFDLSNTRSMISVTPILRKTKEEIDSCKELQVQHKRDMAQFTYREFSELISKLKQEDIHQIILSCWTEEDQSNIIEFVKQYKGKA